MNWTLNPYATQIGGDVGLRGLAFMCLDKLKGKSKDISLLDAGCGTGKLLESCDLYRIFGLEVSERAIEFVKLRH